jgi:orotidine-5'-phosphate decarboxylase
MGCELEYLMSINEQLETGKWVIIVGKEIIKGNNAKEVFEKAKQKYPGKELFIMKVPENTNMLL